MSKGRYGKYPEVKLPKSRAEERFDPSHRWGRHHRIDPHIRYLKPSKRITRVKGKEYTHYVIATSVPKEWKRGVKVTIEPLKGPHPDDYVSADYVRVIERDVNEQGPEFRAFVEEKIEEDKDEADRLVRMVDAWEKGKIA